MGSMMRSSYSEADVTILLKEVTGQMTPLDTRARELRIQGGTHYSEMLPLEYAPTPRYLELYREALRIHSGTTAAAVRQVAEKVYEYKSGKAVLVSLARAGTPVGILIRRWLEQKYHCHVPHYTISIIRGRGIDHNAINYILERHPAGQLQFVDGWIGKGAIIRELQKAVEKYPGVDPALAVLADPARLSHLYGTSEDFLIPSACLNSTVSGLFSRTILNSAVIGPQDFHGAVYYEELAAQDLSADFLQAVQAGFDSAPPLPEGSREADAAEEIEEIARRFGVRDINFIKPGIGETTRVLLRRVPWRILLRDPEDTRFVGHIVRLCTEREVEIVPYPLRNYRVCGIIRDVYADV